MNTKSTRTGGVETARAPAGTDAETDPQTTVTAVEDGSDKPVADNATADDAPPPGAGTRRADAASPARRLLIAVGALVLAAAALGASVVYTVHTFGTSAPVSASTDRDAAVAAARSVAATMTTVKGGDPDATLKAWQAVITGGLADQYGKQEPQLKQRIQQTPSIVTSTVANAALSEFNTAAGTAVALVFVDTTLANPTAGPAQGSTAPSPSAQPAPSAQPGPSAQPAPSTQAGAPAAGASQKQRLALTISLSRTDSGWKASDLKPADPAKVGQ